VEGKVRKIVPRLPDGAVKFKQLLLLAAGIIWVGFGHFRV
jgi:hypothetical protein